MELSNWTFRYLPSSRVAIYMTAVWHGNTKRIFKLLILSAPYFNVIQGPFFPVGSKSMEPIIYTPIEETAMHVILLERGQGQQRDLKWGRWPTVREFESATFMLRGCHVCRLTTVYRQFESIVKWCMLFCLLMSSQSTDYPSDRLTDALVDWLIEQSISTHKFG